MLQPQLFDKTVWKLKEQIYECFSKENATDVVVFGETPYLAKRTDGEVIVLKWSSFVSEAPDNWQELVENFYPASFDAKMSKCQRCYGEGFVTYSENQAPLGSGLGWYQPIQEECPDCLEKGICPNCSLVWSEDTVEEYVDWVSYDRHEKFYCPRCHFENW